MSHLTLISDTSLIVISLSTSNVGSKLSLLSFHVPGSLLLEVLGFLALPREWPGFCGPLCLLGGVP